MLYLVRIVHAFGELCSALSLAMGPYTDAGPGSGQTREQQLTDGIPYMLRDPRQATTPRLVTRSAACASEHWPSRFCNNKCMLGHAAGGVSGGHICSTVLLLGITAPLCRRYSIKRMYPRKHVYLLTPMDSDLGDAPFVAKVVATSYPEQLHEELACVGLAPRLREPVQKYPGGTILCFLRHCILSCSSTREKDQQIGKICVACSVWWLWCFCMQQLLQQPWSGVLLRVNWLFSSVFSACPNCIELCHPLKLHCPVCNALPNLVHVSAQS